MNKENQSAAAVANNGGMNKCIDDLIEDVNLTFAEDKKNLGNEHYRIKNYDDALLLYNEAISLCPNTASYYGNRCACYMMMSNYKLALNDAKYAVILDKRFEKGYIRLAKCYLALGDYINAEQVIKNFMEINKNNNSPYLKVQEDVCKQLRSFDGIIIMHMSIQNYRTALFFVQNALEVAPACLKYKITKAECLAHLGRFDEAISIVVTAMQNDIISADAVYVRALILYYQDNFDKAIQYLERVLQLDPDHNKAKMLRIQIKELKIKKDDGKFAFKIGNYYEALMHFTDALTIDPENETFNCKLYYNIALVNYKLKKLAISIMKCTKVLSIDPRYLKALLLRAKCYMELEQYEESVADYENALKLDRSQELKNLLKSAKLALGKTKEKRYYKVLGVDSEATDEEIKKAYRRKALIHHPDRHTDATEEDRKEQEIKFKEIGEAYGILSDPKKRRKYDNEDRFNMYNMNAERKDFSHFFYSRTNERNGFQFTFNTNGYV